jgi:hypothetical protein
MGLNGRIDWVLIIDAIADETVNFTVELGQQL